MIESKRLFKVLIYRVRHNGPTLRAGNDELSDIILDLLVREKGIVIWENQGVFRLISAPILRNLELTRKASHQIKKDYHRIAGSNGLEEISWNQGIAISPVIVQNLPLVPREELSDTKADTATASNQQATKP